MFDVQIPATEIEIAEAIQASDTTASGIVRRLAFERDRLRVTAKRLEAENARLLARVESAEVKLAEAVCTESCDRGVVLLSSDGPTHVETIDGKRSTIYDHENFSPLGDALINLWETLDGKEEIP